jgi:hypothetical protein
VAEPANAGRGSRRRNNLPYPNRWFIRGHFGRATLLQSSRKFPLEGLQMAGVSNMKLKKTAGAIAISVIFLGGMTFIGSTEAQAIATQLDTSINKALYSR